LAGLLAPPQDRTSSKHTRSSESPPLQQPQRRPTPSGTVTPAWTRDEKRRWRSIQPRERSQDRRAATLRKVGETSISTVLLLRRPQHRAVCDIPRVPVPGNHTRKPLHHNLRSHNPSHILVRSIPHMDSPTVLTSGTNCSNAWHKIPRRTYPFPGD